MKHNRRESRRQIFADAGDALDLCVGLKLRTATRNVTRFIESELVRSGLSLAQFNLLICIANLEEGESGKLVGMTGLDQSTLSRNIRALEKRGLVSTAQDESDLRKRSVQLTESGMRRLEESLAAWKSAQSVLSRRLDPDILSRIVAETEALEVETAAD